MNMKHWHIDSMINMYDSISWNGLNLVFRQNPPQMAWEKSRSLLALDQTL